MTSPAWRRGRPELGGGSPARLRDRRAGRTPGHAGRRRLGSGLHEADRVRVETGDARALSFADAAFDVVVSHRVVHNLPGAQDRSRAISEMLRPGGVLLLADIAHHDAYRAQLTDAGLLDLRGPAQGVETRIVGLLSGGSFRPWALIGRKAGGPPAIGVTGSG